MLSRGDSMQEIEMAPSEIASFFDDLCRVAAA